MDILQEIITNPIVLQAIAITLAAIIGYLVKSKVDSQKIYPLLVFIANLIFRAEKEYPTPKSGFIKKRSVISHIDTYASDEMKMKIMKHYKSIDDAVQDTYDKVCRKVIENGDIDKYRPVR